MLFRTWSLRPHCLPCRCLPYCLPCHCLPSCLPCCCLPRCRLPRRCLPRCHLPCRLRSRYSWETAPSRSSTIQRRPSTTKRFKKGTSQNGWSTPQTQRLSRILAELKLLSTFLKPCSLPPKSAQS